VNRVATWTLGTISGILLSLVAFMAPVMAGVGVGSSCTSYKSQPCVPTVDQVMVSLPYFSGNAAFPMAMATLAILIGLPAWIATLTQTARLRQWGWFVFALIFSPVASLLYAFFGASKPSGVASASASTA
jgi:hypothetical protein